MDKDTTSLGLVDILMQSAVNSTCIKVIPGQLGEKDFQEVIWRATLIIRTLLHLTPHWTTGNGPVLSYVENE